MRIGILGLGMRQGCKGGLRAPADRVLPGQCCHRATGAGFQKDMPPLGPKRLHRIVKPHRAAHMACPIVGVGRLLFGQPIATDGGQDRNLRCAQPDLRHRRPERGQRWFHHMRMKRVAGVQARGHKTRRLQHRRQRRRSLLWSGQHAGFRPIHCRKVKARA